LVISGPEPLTPAHHLDEFSCGKPSLDRWLKTRALSNQEKGFTAVIVVHEANRVIGYYGLAPTAIVPSRLPRSTRTGQPPRPGPLPTARTACDGSKLDRQGLWHRPSQTCAAALRHGRRPHRRARARCQRRRHRSSSVLGATRVHSLKGRSTRPFQIDCRHRSIASLKPGQPGRTGGSYKTRRLIDANTAVPNRLSAPANSKSGDGTGYPSQIMRKLVLETD
jgi:hypothetical protein